MTGLLQVRGLFAPLHLLEPVQLIDEEGFLRALQFIWNVATHTRAVRSLTATICLNILEPIPQFQDPLSRVQGRGNWERHFQSRTLIRRFRQLTCIGLESFSTW